MTESAHTANEPTTRATVTNVLAFPWHQLDTTTRAEAQALADVRRAAREVIHAEALGQAIGDLVGARVELRLRRVTHLARSEAPDPSLVDGVGVLFALADDGAELASNGIRVDAESALAGALIARVLKRPRPAVLDPARIAGSSLAGALGAILVAASRRAHAGAPLRIVDANSSRALASKLEDAAGESVLATVTVLVDDEAFLARVSFPAARLQRTVLAPWSWAALAALGDTTLRLAIVACTSAATATEIAALAPGDAWMPGAWSLGMPGALAGPVCLAAPASEHGLRADLGPHGRVVVRGKRVDLAWSVDPETRGVMSMAEPEKTTDSNALAEVLGDVPVVVRVEIGTVEMRAREWAALDAGDVVTLGRKIAEPVVLRAGGVEIARGELIQIDGEVGVRILTRTRSTESNA